ncbi:hypothetical protein C1645_813052 [Glomus cerebriforme]|uniref:HAT C-terminal dimerisation domain-containing protein n=1 Tax=Glomus cerebriforme TaxID=658196 RepID=A0A397TIY7_9GLOM|nr:hypothetical protein C1645_813052 [Glomus cerebriforme]
MDKILEDQYGSDNTSCEESDKISDSSDKSNSSDESSTSDSSGKLIYHIPYLEKVYTFEYAAYIYRVMQKYIAKTDKFSEALLWASIKYSTAADHNWTNFGFIHSKLHAHLNNDRVKKLVTLYQNLRVRKDISEDIWFKNDEN